MIDYTKLKKGEIITMIDEYDNIRIIIVNKVIGNHRLYTYVELDNAGDVFFEKYEPGVYHDLNNCVCRNAEDEEKDELYNALVRAFKDYDLGWAKHFTDSTYDDIRDWLCWEFNVNLDSLADNIIVGDNNPLVDTIYEITNYIWDALCKETDNYQACTDYIESEMVNKQEFIEKTWQWLKAHIKFETISYNDVWDMSVIDILATDFTTIDEMEESFRKIMEE